MAVDVPHHPQPPALHAPGPADHQQGGCDTQVERGAARARAAYPDTLSDMDLRRGRIAYIIKHRFDLFDEDGDGYLSFDEYLTSQWASFVALLPPGTCRVTKEQFMWIHLGARNAPDSGWSIPGQIKLIEHLYYESDVTYKGYIVREDLTARALKSFRLADRHGRGKLSREELGNK